MPTLFRINVNSFLHPINKKQCKNCPFIHFWVFKDEPLKESKPWYGRDIQFPDFLFMIHVFQCIKSMISCVSRNDSGYIDSSIWISDQIIFILFHFSKHLNLFFLIINKLSKIVCYEVGLLRILVLFSTNFQDSFGGNWWLIPERNRKLGSF